MKRFGASLLWYGAMEGREQALPGFSRLFQSLGLGVARFDVYWGLCEPQKGVYDWTLTDALVASVPLGTEIIFTVYCVSPWGSKHADCRKLAQAEKPGGVFSSLPQDVLAYYAFLKALVTRYRDKVEFWQIENEVYGATVYTASCPPMSTFWIGTAGEYVTLLNASYDAIKSVQPDAKILLAGKASSSDLSAFFRQVVKDTASKADLIVDVHLYGKAADSATLIKNVRSLTTKPIWVTESGEVDTNVFDGFDASFTTLAEYKLQVEELAKRLALTFAAGAERVMRLRLPAYPGDSPKANWPHMRLTDDVAGTARRPACDAFGALVKAIENFTAVTTLAVGQYKFMVAGKPVILAWSDTAKIVNFKTALGTSKAHVTTLSVIMGQLPKTSYQLSKVKLGPTPVIIER